MKYSGTYRLKTIQPAKIRREIEKLWFFYNPESDFSHKFNEIKKQVKAKKFFSKLQETEVVSFINSIIQNNHVHDIFKISKISDLKEREAAIILSKTYFAEIPTNEFIIRSDSTKERVFENPYFDFTKNKIKPIELEAKKSIAEIKKDIEQFNTDFWASRT